MTTAAKLPLRLKLGHGLGSIAYGVKDNGFSTFLLIYYNQVLGMDAKLVSFALLVALVLDAFVDPVVGHMSDRTYTRWGRRLPWLYLAPIPLGIAWLFLWAPTDPAHISFGYLVGVAFVVRALVSACEVPSVALVPELTRDYDERTGLMRFRYLFGWAGGLLMLFLAYGVFLVPDAEHKVGQLNPVGYWKYGLFGGLLMAAAVLLSAAAQHRWAARLPERKPEPFSLGAAFSEIREAFSHPAFLVLFFAGALAYTSQGITFSIANYLYLYVWRFSQDAFQLYPLLLFLSVIGSFFLVAPMHKRWGKRWSAIGSGLLGVGFWVTPFALRYVDAWPTEGSVQSTAGLFAFFFFANVFSVIVMISGSSMIADIVEASEVETGKRTEGTFFAGNFFMQKCATGLGIFATGMIVSLAGMPEKAQPGAVDKQVIDDLTLYYCAIILVLAIVSSMIFTRFPIERADHEARLKLLDEAARADADASGAHP
ncbi:MFS transporter [Sphingopyxis sp.]|uniref:MFS transporter n=1 Tax=Sphingopyxis sp. TaxID=1908224 RepID=UPI003BAB8738